MIDRDCIFCKIAGGDIPSSTVYEDEQFRVLLDLSPATKGHALILPKQHYANIFEIDENVLRDLIVLAKKVASAMKETLNCDGVNIVQNNGEAAGQTVFHFHMHLIPRYNGDSVGLTWTPGTLTDEAKEEIMEKVKAQLS